MADPKPSFQSTIKKVEKPQPSLLDRIAEYLGYEKKSDIPADAQLLPDSLKPKTPEKPPISQPYKNMKKADKSTQDSSVRASVSTSTKTAKPQEEIPIAELPSTKEVDVQDPRNTQFREPTKQSPEQGVVDFLNIEPLKRLVEGSLQKGPPLMSSLSDKIPERKNIDVAEEFIDKYKDTILNANRTDLRPALALLDYWTGGKSNLASSYTPPTSTDDMYKTMMQFDQAGVKERSDSELKQRDILLDAYQKIFIKPRTDILDAASRVNQGTGRDISSMLRNINSAMQSGENVFSNNSTKLQGELLKTRSEREIAVRKYRSQADLLNTRINAELGRRGARDKNDYYKNIDRVLATIVAPKFTKSGTTLPEDRKEWSKSNSKTLGAIINFADFVIASRGFDVKEHDIDELMRLRVNVLNEIAMGYNNGEFTDPELQQLSEEFHGKSGN